MYNVKVLKDCGSVAVLLYEEVKARGGDNDFIPLQVNEVIEVMGIPLVTQNRAMQKLKDKGYVETKVVGHPPKRYVKIVR